MKVAQVWNENISWSIISIQIVFSHASKDLRDNPLQRRDQNGRLKSELLIFLQDLLQATGQVVKWVGFKSALFLWL
jgi:hypothetical protein